MIRTAVLSVFLAFALLLSFPLSGRAQENSTAAPPGAIREVIVEGALRVERETIVSYLTLGVGDAFSAPEMNRSFKQLFATGLFTDVSIGQDGDALLVRVVENPIINRVVFEGNDIVPDEELAQETLLKSRMVYTATAVGRDVENILELYRRRGRFAVQVSPKTIQRAQNRVDLVFEIAEGPKTGMEQITFIGNRFFSDSDLREALLTKEQRWYRIFSSVDSYDPDRLEIDKELLARHYTSNGFIDFRIVSTAVEFAPERSGFIMTFTIDEGKRYKFGEVKIESRIEDVAAAELTGLFRTRSGDWYDSGAVDRTVEVISTELGNRGYAFAQVEPRINVDWGASKVNIVFTVREGRKVYIERINIEGNTRTSDNVIRREFLLAEGDAYDASRLRRSRQRVMNLGFFKVVNINSLPGESADSVVINLQVEEQPTGELSIGAGYSSTDGAMAELAIQERNLLGEGRQLRLATTLAEKGNTIDLSLTEPYFLNRDLSLGGDVFHIVRDNQDYSSYDSRETGAGVRLGYSLTEYWSHSVGYRFSRETVENVKDNASIYVKAQEGTEDISLLYHVLTYDRRNSSVSPTSGYMASLRNSFAGPGGTVNYLSSKIAGTYYYPFTDSVYGVASATAGYIDGLGENVRLNDRFFLGGDSLRGFDTAGIGPRDVATDDSLGGSRSFSGSLELRFPIGLPNELGIMGALFTDFGVLTGVEESGASIRDDRSIRSAVGVGLNWNSPIGPFRFSFARAINKEEYDKTQTFNFSIGTRF